MLKSPALYYVSADYQEDDRSLIQKRADTAHSADVLLEKYNLVKYERASGVTRLLHSLFCLGFRNHHCYFVLQRRFTLTGRSAESSEEATE